MANNIVALAPMVDVTTREFRELAEMIAPRAEMFTEMIPANTAVHCDSETLERLVGSRASNTVVQVAGTDKEQIAAAVSRIQELPSTDGCVFRSFNLNVGCPSDRVSSGGFGACQMNSPEKVSEILSYVCEKTGSIMSVKCRIGLDGWEFSDFENFVKILGENSPIRRLYVHARIALLGKRLTPKKNRYIPPIRYDYAYKIKKTRDVLEVVVNGGIKSVEEAVEHCRHTDGVMIGRMAASDLIGFGAISGKLQGTSHTCTKCVNDIVHRYIEHATQNSWDHKRTLRPIVSLMGGKKGAKKVRITVAHSKSLIETRHGLCEVIGEAYRKTEKCLCNVQRTQLLH